jgi:hypothetical protein
MCLYLKTSQDNQASKVEAVMETTTTQKEGTKI